MARHFLYSVFELDVTLSLVNGNGLEFSRKFLNIGFVRGQVQQLDTPLVGSQMIIQQQKPPNLFLQVLKYSHGDTYSTVSLYMLDVVVSAKAYHLHFSTCKTNHYHSNTENSQPQNQTQRTYLNSIPLYKTMRFYKDLPTEPHGIFSPFLRRFTQLYKT